MAREAKLSKASTHINVNIDKVKNGYIVSKQDDRTFRSTKFVEKTKAAATERASKLL